MTEAVSLLASGDSRVLSGGTDFYPSLGEGVVQERLVDISGLVDLRGISIHPDHIRMGGLTTWTDIIRTPLPPFLDALKSAAREVGSVQIQNRGTVAGNLCNASPAADGVPPLLALDAEVELISQGGVRRMPVGQFISGNRKTLRKADELLSAVLIPRELENAASQFVKLGARRYLVISITMIAVVVKLDEKRNIQVARIAVGSCSSVARRLPALEDELVGATELQLQTIVRKEHLDVLAPIDDVRATAEYRMEASLRMVQRALTACMETS